MPGGRPWQGSPKTCFTVHATIIWFNNAAVIWYTGPQPTTHQYRLSTVTSFTVTGGLLALKLMYYHSTGRLSVCYSVFTDVSQRETVYVTVTLLLLDVGGDGGPRWINTAQCIRHSRSDARHRRWKPRTSQLRSSDQRQQEGRCRYNSYLLRRSMF